MTQETLDNILNENTRAHPEQVWMRERKGDDFRNWTWQESHDQIMAVGAWLEEKFDGATNIALLSKNRPHWFLADLSIIVSGNVSVPLFTTLSKEHSEYILEFAEVKLLFLGETSNWDAVDSVLPDDIEVVTLPGIDCSRPHTRWDDIIAENAGRLTSHQPRNEDMLSIVFTSGTTGVPKGVIQTHRSSITPVHRMQTILDIPKPVQMFSYLPLAHIAERQLVEFYSVVYAGQVTFNESLETLVRDLSEATPDYLFGAPRVWEQLQQGIIASFGSAEKMRAALQVGGEKIAAAIREKLGLQNAKTLLSAAAPAPPSVLEWYASIGLPLVEGFGQTEAMGLIGNTPDENRVGSIGKPADGVEIMLGENNELLVKADGLSPGYYKHPNKTAQLWQDGWLHTGDKASIDKDGFVFLSGRVKDYFKTIHGKFVAPAPIEGAFAACHDVEQLCLLGRGYSKTVMICVLTQQASDKSKDDLYDSLRKQIDVANKAVEHHARIGAVIVTREPWTITNGFLTPTLKIRRDEVENFFGAQAQQMAREAAEGHVELIAWH